MASMWHVHMVIALLKCKLNPGIRLKITTYRIEKLSISRASDTYYIGCGVCSY